MDGAEEIDRICEVGAGCGDFGLGVAFLGQCAVEKRDAESDILDAAERFGGDREGFRRDMGQSILGYLNEQRLNHAVSLLTTTDLPVAVIAENAGFADPSYFARFFRKSAGLTPSEYRKEKAARR